MVSPNFCKSCLALALFIVLFACSKQHKNDNSPLPVGHQENMHAATEMQYALNYMGLYNDSLAHHGTSNYHVNHFDSLFWHHNSIFWHHHGQYHLNDTAHHDNHTQVHHHTIDSLHHQHHDILDSLNHLPHHHSH